MVLDLNGKSLSDDLSEQLTFSCTNKAVLSRNTGIAYHKLVYWFTDLDKSVMVNGTDLVIRSKTHYKGNQPGGFKKTTIRSRNYGE
jgi:hypothetical protein